MEQAPVHGGTASSHSYNLQHFKSRVSNPGAIAYVHFNMPLKSSHLPGAGPIFPDIELQAGPQRLEGTSVHYRLAVSRNLSGTRQLSRGVSCVLWLSKTVHNGDGPRRVRKHSPNESQNTTSEFRDVVFEDVVFDNNRLSLLLYLDVT